MSPAATVGPSHLAARSSERRLLLATVVDTARHFEPLAALKQTVDALAYAKLNVLHWCALAHSIHWMLALIAMSHDG